MSNYCEKVRIIHHINLSVSVCIAYPDCVSLKEKFSMESEQKKLFGLSLFLYFISASLVLLINSDFAGARADSFFYLKMISSANPRNSFPSIENYEVATSPVFVFLIGLLNLFVGNNLGVFVHILYILLAIASLFLLSHLLKPTRWQVSAPIVCLLSTSGYFVAPSIWPTSDTPTIFFALLSLVSLLENRDKLFIMSSFMLVSTRQNFAWLLLAFLIFEIYANCGNLKNIALALMRYIPALVSLIFTFLYFENNLTPQMYNLLNIKNVFQLPNFLTSVQIGLSMLSTVGLFLLFQNWTDLIKTFKFRFLTLVLPLSFFPLGYNFYGVNQKIGDGLGWISLLVNEINLNIFSVTVLSSFGLILFCVLFIQGILLQKSLPIFMLICLILSSLVMQIPFLRYFEFSVILIVCLSLRRPANLLSSLSNWKLSILSLGITLLNLLKFSA